MLSVYVEQHFALNAIRIPIVLALALCSRDGKRNVHQIVMMISG